MPRSLRLSGKFNPEEAEIIKEFQNNPIIDFELPSDATLFSKKEKLSDNKLVRWAIFELIITRRGGEIGDLLRKPEFDLDTWAEMLQKQTDDLLKKKKPGPKKEKRKRGRPKRGEGEI